MWTAADTSLRDARSIRFHIASLVPRRTWEEQYRPQWKDITVLEFAKNRCKDNDYMVKKLAGLGVNDTAAEEDLRVAMRTIKKRFVVGLLDRMEESIRRFNVVLGIDEGDEENRRCMNHLLHDSVGARRYRSASHPKVGAHGMLFDLLPHCCPGPGSFWRLCLFAYLLCLPN